MGLAPDLAGGIDDEGEFAPLGVDREQVARSDGSEAALRADGEIFERDVACGFVDVAAKIILGFKLRLLRSDEAEDNCLAARHEAQRLQGAGAVALRRGGE